MAEGFLFYSALSDLNFGYITEATAFAVASVCRKSQAEMLGFFIDMWYNKYGDERC